MPRLKKYDAEIEKALLENEKAVLKELKKQYTKSLADIKRRIAILTAKNQTQSVVYQLGYQQALEKQINSIIELLKNKNLKTINDYLELMYQDGYIGLNYSIMQQGIPLVIPINQDAILASINKQIAGMTFADRIGINMNDFKQTIKDEITRGLASNMTYGEIAINISRTAEHNLNKAYRIARTEGHRVTQEARYEGMTQAKNRGADVVKEWNSTLDGDTRPAHQELDGQIRELDEPFNSSAGNPMYPGNFGIASQDISCRCIVLQRARWVLDNEAHERMAKINGVNQLIKVKNYEDYKKGYYSVSDRVDEEVQKVIKEANERIASYKR